MCTWLPEQASGDGVESPAAIDLEQNILVVKFSAVIPRFGYYEVKLLRNDSLSLDLLVFLKYLQNYHQGDF